MPVRYAVIWTVLSLALLYPPSSEGAARASREIQGGQRLILSASGRKAYRTAVLDLRPNTYHRLGEGSGTSAVDLGAAALNYTYESNITLGVAGAIVSDGNTAVTFPSATARATATQNTLEYTGDFSILYWCKHATTNTSYSALWYNTDNGATADGIYTQYTSASPPNIEWGIVGGNNIRSTSTFAAGGAYVFICCVRSGASGYLYVNMTQEASAAQASNPVWTGTDQPMFGDRLGGLHNRDVTMDEVATFTRALSVADMTTLYNIAKGTQ